MKTTIFWDIDGTLLTTARGSMLAWEEATLQLLGKNVDLSRMDTAGLTDVEIAVKIFSEKGGIAPSLGQMQEMLKIYEQSLPGCLHMKKGSVLPGVLKTLDFLESRDDMVSFLLTGNTALGARAKLDHYGLGGYFCDGSYARAGWGRQEMLKNAFLCALRKLGQEFDKDRVYIVGDTPHDIRWGKAVGARTIAVATGIYPMVALLIYEPWWTLERLPDPDIFASRVCSPV